MNDKTKGKVEVETTFRVLNSDLRVALLVRVDEQGMVSIEDFQDSTPVPEFCRLLRGLATSIEKSYPDISQAEALLDNIRGQASCNHFLPVLG